MMERIRQKIGKVQEYLLLINSIKGEFMERFQTDMIYRGALLHYLYLLADTCISLGEMIIKHRGLRTPQSYQDVFDILGENGILETSFAYDFAKIAGFRNFLAHDYEKIEADSICKDVRM
ncbi:MAG: DUF86 domain-containing protein [Nitrospirae bacterium]|nr:DUF86 domain-containing protein [Nitrospirota bacterium]